MDYQAQDGNRQEVNVEMRGEGSMSISRLIRNSALQLESECRRLEKEYEDAVAEDTVLSEICETQSKNIAKQQADLEHLKLMIHKGAMNRETSEAKISDLTEKIQELEKNFTSWFRTINGLMGSKEVLSQIFSDKMVKEEQQQNYCKHLEASYESVLSYIRQTKNELLETKEKEEQQLDHIIEQLKSQLEIQTEEESRLKNQLQEIRACKNEKIIMINTISPDCAELEFAVNELKQTMSNEKNEMDYLMNQLRANLQELVGKKETLEGQVEAADKMINEKTNLIRDLDLENKILETNLKEQIAKEEEYIKIKEEELNTFKCLGVDNEALKEKFATLKRIEEENALLQLQCEEMGLTMQGWDSNIENIKYKENSYMEELERQDALIKKLEEDKKNLINDGIKLDEKLADLQREMDDSAKEHVKNSAEIDVPFNSLIKESETLKEAVAETKLLLKEANEKRDFNEDVLGDLQARLEEAKTLSEENDIKLINESNMQDEILRALKEEENNLDDMITKTIEEYEEALTDGKICEETKEHIQSLESQIASNKETFEKSLNNLKDSHKQEKEEKEIEKEKQGIQYEREFRTKEQSKTDALVELKETNLRVADIQQQIKSREEETNRLKNTIVKVDNLKSNLEQKLRNVAQVATTVEASQSLADPYSQRSILETPKPKKKLPSNIMSPDGSEANYVPFNMKEDIYINRLSPKRMSSGPNIKEKKTIPEEKKKKKSDYPWDF